MNKYYGDLSICFFTSRTFTNNRQCHPLTVNSEISFNSGSLCTPDSSCDLQYSLTANNSQIKCAGNDKYLLEYVLALKDNGSIINTNSVLNMRFSPFKFMAVCYALLVIFLLFLAIRQESFHVQFQALLLLSVITIIIPYIDFTPCYGLYSQC